MSARDQVLALPEMLESVLLELPMRDLLLAQRVCKTWQEAIKSKPIQRKLFFLPMKDGEEPLAYLQVEVKGPKVKSETSSSPREDVIVQNTGTHLQYMWTHSSHKSLGDSKPVPIYLNPVLAVLWSKIDAAAIKSDTSADLLREDAWRHPEASWRSMLVTQPSFHAQSVTIDSKKSIPCMRARWGENSTPGWELISKFPEHIGSVHEGTIKRFRGCWQSSHAFFDPLSLMAPEEMRINVEGSHLWEILGREGWGWKKVTGSDMGI